MSTFSMSYGALTLQLESLGAEAAREAEASPNMQRFVEQLTGKVSMPFARLLRHCECSVCEYHSASLLQASAHDGVQNGTKVEHRTKAAVKVQVTRRRWLSTTRHKAEIHLGQCCSPFSIMIILTSICDGAQRVQ